MLSVKQVTKTYGTLTALENISIEFTHGVYGLLAPNGAGKTTLLKMLTTLLFPTRGQIEYNGSPITTLDEQYRDLLGYLPQEFGYYKNDTPDKYLTYLAALKGMSRKDAQQRIPEVLQAVGLRDVQSRKMKTFSGGMIQRVGIAQALLNDPKILILDEPTAGLDPKERARFRKLLTSLATDRIIIVSTHIVSDVAFIANEIIMLKSGQLLYKASNEAICATLEGHLFEADINTKEADVFRQKHSVLSERVSQDFYSFRFVSKQAALPAWRPVDPQLEDVFLFEYEEDGTPL
ncbi:ATP-binding cassette domain-containing protein [Aureibacillus halotolerans]|uniref:ABC-type multidrug transport system ATPase subunit n=1 Tax=Aureibacillus halotolerans TaxID=1508390 RepID=A0A4R6UIJ6_9BACI|nr:ATP-binding cassette domain-containing protein [Aureibacillus halotolerans]TDQ42994.1 ABC-type multidrug transport system ATPase subunit [Aureibacillus halotolerans]